MFIFSTVALGVMYLMYRSLDQKESQFIVSFGELYGDHLGSINLGLLSVNGKDSLSWGSKLYLYTKGLVIGNPQDKDNICILLNNIERAECTPRSVKLTCNSQNSTSPLTLVLGNTPLDKNIAKSLTQLLKPEVLSW